MGFNGGRIISYAMEKKIKIILPNASIKPKALRERTDLSPLIKTAIYRYHNDGVDTYLYWFNQLSSIQKLAVCLEGLIPYFGKRTLVERESIKKIKL
jgi:hypothetical protein